MKLHPSLRRQVSSLAQALRGFREAVLEVASIAGRIPAALLGFSGAFLLLLALASFALGVYALADHLLALGRYCAEAGR